MTQPKFKKGDLIYHRDPHRDIACLCVFIKSHGDNAAIRGIGIENGMRFIKTAIVPLHTIEPRAHPDELDEFLKLSEENP